MRQALRTKGQAQRQQISSLQSFPSPVGGWNARDSLAEMPPTDAVRLLNWFPRTTDCMIRPGSDDHATGITGTVETLAVYAATSGTNAMFAATDSGVWDVTTAGAVGAAESATSTDGRWQTVMFGDGTNNWLIMVNGTDKPLYYNGTWVEVDGVSTPALTGVTTTTLVHVNVYKSRLFFIQEGTLSYWYLPAGSSGGALTEVDLGPFAGMGGYLMAMGTWSFDGGGGPDDYAAFVTSEGQVLVYTGTNPSDAAAWSLKGVYNVGKPLSRRCFTKLGGDLILLTENGAYPMSAVLQSSTIDRRLALTNKIENAFTEAAQAYGANFGWETTYFPSQVALVCNVPVNESGSQEQYVMNTITKSWCRFDAWGAQTFGIFNSELYYGTSGKVVKAWTGVSDNGTNIVADGKQAFSYFGKGSQQKQFKMFRPVLGVNGNLSFLVGMDVDFGDTPITGEASYSVTSNAQWDVSSWDVAMWAANLEIVKQWKSPQQNLGYAAAGKLKIATNSLEVVWMASDYLYEAGGVL